MNRDKFESIVSTVIAIAALAVAAATLVSVFGRGRVAGQADRETSDPVYLADWSDLLALGTPMGSPGAPVSVVEFADFECPACGQFEVAVSSLPDTVSAKLRLTLVHLPMPYHRFAIPAAVAFECAASQGQGAEMRSVLFARQDSFGLLPWVTFGTRAGVPRIREFEECMVSRPHMGKIDSGLAAGRRFAIRGTPTLIVNGWQLDYVPTTRELHALIGAFATGRIPFRQ